MIAIFRGFDFAAYGPTWLWAVTVALWCVLAAYFVFESVWPVLVRAWRTRRGDASTRP